MKKIISGDGSATLFNEQYGQTYHSVHGAVIESTLVYLENSGVAARLEKGLDTHILEIGFGLGLNFLLTARKSVQTNTRLSYLAFEHAPISKQTFNALSYENIDELENLIEPTAQIFDTLSSQPQAALKFKGLIELDVQHANALTATLSDNQFDAVFLDAFSPESNPELWSRTFLDKLFIALKPGGVVSTYCVKGDVRRAFIDVGFDVMKLPGPPGKREVLTAKRL